MQISFHQDWSQWLHWPNRWNWRNFTFIEFTIERSYRRSLGFDDLEINLGFLGFAVWMEFSWNGPEQEGQTKSE